MKTKTKIGLTLGLLSLLALGGLTQSKYVRNATIEMDVTSETDPGVFLVNNTLKGNAGLPWTNYTIPKTGYYAIQLRGGDGGTNEDAKGGKGGIVEAVYYFVKDQQIRYTLGGRGGWQSDEINSQNRDPGASSHSAGGTGGGGTPSARQGSGGGGSSAVDFGDSKFPLLVAGGGGGGTGNKGTVALGGVGASNVDGAYGPSNYPNLTGKLQAANLSYRSGAGTKDGQNQDLTNWTWGGGGSGGGFEASWDGGRNAGSLLKKRDPGAGTGGHSYVNPTVNGVGFIALTSAIKATYAAKLPASGGDFTPYNNGNNTGGGDNSIAGQIRIAYLWSDTTADHTAIDNIYK